MPHIPRRENPRIMPRSRASMRAYAKVVRVRATAGGAGDSTGFSATIWAARAQSAAMSTGMTAATQVCASCDGTADKNESRTSLLPRHRAVATTQPAKSVRRAIIR